MSPKLTYKFSTPKGVFETWDQKPNIPLFHLAQTHSNFITHLDPTNHNNLSEGDGLIYSGNEAVNLAIVTADCLPILVLGTKGIAMIHAGWQGLAAGIMEKPEIRSLCPQVFHIGPHIMAKAYQVGIEFKQYFPKSKAFTLIDNKLYFDLEKEARNQIEKRFPFAETESSGICTYNDQHFHSHRRDGTSLRNWNVFKFQKT
ncbi:MAG: polyphenol oxidase family protein [Halobacteriovoraceae bacterium]|jgi:polyphenol oxidase|nr:polyphenol oxidase family protein [Halobacteriovoraceae bacterium]MBT5095736.1 polyphenol oxidase family protein [Halobacteriovoraceae bacterium]